MAQGIRRKAISSKDLISIKKGKVDATNNRRPFVVECIYKGGSNLI